MTDSNTAPTPRASFFHEIWAAADSMGIVAVDERDDHTVFTFADTQAAHRFAGEARRWGSSAQIVDADGAMQWDGSSVAVSS